MRMSINASSLPNSCHLRPNFPAQLRALFAIRCQSDPSPFGDVTTPFLSSKTCGAAVLPEFVGRATKGGSTCVVLPSTLPGGGLLEPTSVVKLGS